MSFKYIVALYEEDEKGGLAGLKACHKLTHKHVYITDFLKMNVPLAAQVGVLPA